MSKVAIVDYGIGNLDSVARAVQECGAQTVVTAGREELGTASALILPGVGSFAAGMQAIRERGLDRILTEHVVQNRIPVLGICLGMQLMARCGFEPQETAGLGWLDAEVRRLEPATAEERIPHVGWNEVHPARPSPLFEGVPAGKDFYFVHSFHVLCRETQDVAARTPYCGEFVSAVHRGHIFGVQFHPEKSQRFGAQVVRNFLGYRPC